MLPKRFWLPLSSLIGLVALLFYPFAQPGVAYSDDILVTIYRVFALRQSWAAAIFYPRVAPDLAFGYGVPLFQYYPPLSTYLSAFLTLLGMGTVDAVKVTFALTLLWGGIGTFFYARSWFKSTAAAWLAALVFMAAPYQLADVYVRGATAEALGLALLPWILWSTHSLFRAPQTGYWFSGCTLLLTTLLISHNALSLFFMPILLAVALLEAWQSNQRRRLLYFGAAITLALGISAFFWLPALVERSHVNIDAMTAGYYDPLNHLKPLGEVIQQSLLFQYERPTVYSFGWLPLALALIAALGLALRKPHHRHWIGLGMLLIIVPLLLQLPAAAPFWQDLPLVRFIQFPWRLFAFATLSIALLIGALPRLFQHKRKQQWALALCLGIVIVGYSFAALPTRYDSEVATGSFSNENVNHRDLYERGKLGFELFSDYQPTSVQIPLTDLPNSPAATPLATSALVLPILQLQSYRGLSLHTTVDSAREAEIHLNRFYLPGWQARLDGEPLSVYPSGELGLVAAKVPPGQHDLLMTFGATPLRQWTVRLSIVALLIWLFTLLAQWTKARQALLITVVAGLLLTSWVEMRSLWDFARGDAAQSVSGQVGDFAELLGYSLDQASYQAGETIQLTIYWRARQPVATEYKVFVHLRDMGDTQMAAQHDGAPVYGFTPTTRWLPGEILDDSHPLPIDSAVPPGTYQLAVGMYDPNTVTNLPVQSAKTLPGDRIVLGTVEVRD